VSAGPSLYRRHRPRTFAEVVGQDHVVRTLTNAVARDRVHHAYLFVGSRGTGKTSMAKILAACLNCVRGPTVDPCGVCDSCRSIASASSLDVIEMDAASSNSVDDIRALRDSVAYAPVSGRQKIYILDEAHMLSTAAWNAFLKTLEEPPPNTVFVLATTEPQKVPATVVDRCHRFDFQRPTVEQIATVVARTATAEQIVIGPEAVAMLARHASGSFRDALGTLEQLQTYAGADIALGDVLAVLGISDAELLFEAFDAITDADPRGALAAAANAVEGGHDPAAFIRELEIHARELLIVQIAGGEVPAELSLTPERDERIAAQAARLGAGTLVRTLDLLAAALTHLRAGADARTQLELAVVKAARADLDPSLAALASRIEQLESGVPAVPASQTQTHAEPAGLERSRPVAAEEFPPATEFETPLEFQPATEFETPVEFQPPTEFETPVEFHPPTELETPARSETASKSERAAQAHAGPEPEGVPQSVVAAQAVSSELSFERLIGLWPDVLDTVRASNAMLGAVVDVARPVELAGDRLVLAFAEDADFQRRKAEERATRSALSEAVRAVTGHALTFSYEQRQGPPAPLPLSDDELVARLKDEFDAEELGDTEDEEAR
jgi:DNA polymerase-3 subunit gamma/tau